MKIRSDFVTNSSSSSSAELVVENPVLLEILERYKAQGSFGEKGTTFGIGEYNKAPEGVGYFGFYDSNKDIPIPAFAFSEDAMGDGWCVATHRPQSLEGVLSLIIDVMQSSKNYYYATYTSEGRLNVYHPELYEQLVVELKQRSEEIINAFTRVCYYCHRNEPENEEPVVYLRFEYDPINGVKISEEIDEDYCSDWEDEDRDEVYIKEDEDRHEVYIKKEDDTDDWSIRDLFLL